MPIHTLDIQSPLDHRRGSSAADPVHSRGRTTDNFIREAQHLFQEHDLVVPERDSIELIVRLALEAQQLYFAAVLFEPDATQFDRFFSTFIKLCAADMADMSGLWLDRRE